MGDFHSTQNSCVSMMTQLNRKLRDFQGTLKKYADNIVEMLGVAVTWG